jgi:hypothetical protein
MPKRDLHRHRAQRRALHVLHVLEGGSLGDHQALANLARCEPLCHQHGHLLLTRGQWAAHSAGRQ